MQTDIINKIEAILFYLAEPVDVGFLAKTLEISKQEVLSAIEELEVSLNGRGVKLILHEDEVVIATAPEYSTVIEKIIKEERERDLGRAGIETLSIVAYKGPISKKEIEYIRGVNCQYALRNLLLRGLVGRKNGEIDARVVSYNITGDALRYLGLSHVSDLPEYAEVRKQLEIVEEKDLDQDENGGEKVENIE